MFSGGRIPIRIYVGGLFIVLTLAIGLSMAALFYARMKSTVMVMSNDLFDRTATLVAADVAAQRSQIAVSLGFAARSELARATTLAARLRALDVLGETLEANPWVVAAYVGYPDGNFLLVRRRPEVRTSIGNVPPRTQFLVQSIDRSTGAPRGEYLFYDARLQQIAARAAPEYRFDPRSRPWYAAAGSGGVAVTAPYVFFTTRQIGITMSLRSAAQSVFGADIDLGNISDELARLRPTPGSLAAIVGRDGALLAYSDPAAFAQTTAGAGRAPVLTALGSPALAAAFANAGPAMHAEGQYHDPAGRWWIFRVTPVLAGVGTPRALLLAVPADELYADANRAIAAATLLGVVLLALWVPCALWLARLIARPLIVLREGAQALRNRDFSDDHKPPASMIAEIHELADTFVAMRRHVREHNDAASRFVPHAFLEQLERADIVSLELGDHAERNMTILFSDIRSFTTLSESMSPQQTFNFVNSYLTRVGPIIRNHRGFIDKYIGGRHHGPLSGAPRRCDGGGGCDAAACRRLQRGAGARRLRADRDRYRAPHGRPHAGDDRRVTALRNDGHCRCRERRGPSGEPDQDVRLVDPRQRPGHRSGR